ncbi:hypothetical protein BH23BAC4_BH23BAC4_05740 [soil metagenome]
MSILARAAVIACALVFTAPASAQTIVKYGAEFLAGGVGGRALGMGGAHVALAGDVTAGYWNVAGLDQIEHLDIAYMHAERFGGIVSFDYGAVAYPLNERSTVGVSFFRSGVDDIANTLAAMNPDTGLPRPNPENHITYFSAADYAVFLSYARRLRPNLSVGASAKIVRRGIGDFASAWGYSADIGVQYSRGRVRLGANLQDVTSMVQAWSVNDAAFQGFEEMFGEDRPVGLTEITLPVARLGSGYVMPITNDIQAAFGLDVDVAFDGQQAYVMNVGDISFQPRIGTEFTYRDLVSLRAGISNVTTSERYGTQLTPTLGAGLRLDQVSIDYGFGDFGGLQSELGFSHRISVRLTLEQPRFARPPR